MPARIASIVTGVDVRMAKGFFTVLCALIATYKTITATDHYIMYCPLRGIQWRHLTLQ